MFSLPSPTFQSLIPEPFTVYAPLRYKSFEDLAQPEPVDQSWFKASRPPTPQILSPMEQASPEPSSSMPQSKSQKRGRRWTDEEDSVLLEIVEKMGPNWKDIAFHFPGKTSKQVKERWSNQLDPSISDRPWSAEDDFLLVSLIREYGRSWCKISKTMSGRTELMLKNRFHSFLRKKLNPETFECVGKMSKEEEVVIRTKLNKFPRKMTMAASSQASTASNSPVHSLGSRKSFSTNEWTATAIL